MIYAGNFLNQLSDSEIPAYIDTVNEKLKYILIFKLDHSDDCRPTTTFALRSPEVYMKLISESESFKQNKIKIAFETFTINKYPELVIIVKRIDPLDLKVVKTPDEAKLFARAFAKDGSRSVLYDKLGENIYPGRSTYFVDSSKAPGEA